MEVYTVKFKILKDVNCISYQDEEMVKLSQHFLVKCSAYVSSRLKYLGFHNLGHPGE